MLDFAIVAPMRSRVLRGIIGYGGFCRTYAAQRFAGNGARASRAAADRTRIEVQPKTSFAHGGRIGAALMLACPLLSPAMPAHAATSAGTRIVNVASLDFEDAGRTERVTSNAVTLTVGEVLDVAITTPAERIAVERGDTAVAVPFTVTNQGNAGETFALAVGTDRDAATIAGLATDTNDDALYDPAIDQPVAIAELSLEPGRSQRVFVLVRGAAADGDATAVTATATAATGQGAPGSVFAGAGLDASDAVVGRTGARATASTRIVPGAAAPSLAKSLSVLAPDGSARVGPGSIITYRLDARFPGAAVAVEIADPIPAGTRFVAGSIRVDGRTASDAADDDAAAFDGTAVRVALGEIAAASDRSIQFDVQIQ